MTIKKLLQHNRDQNSTNLNRNSVLDVHCKDELEFQRPGVDDGGGSRPTNENMVDLRGTFAHDPIS